ncbi:hypothetical protein [Dyadobacter sp. CY356]|uniref:hypothetical protein n=1 Tax=Dyadobacter sp. CY356 TaxID=2906442 RepID=UPI001F3377CD|nr:hypothetical protein [Dyadobacter sp. CY356]MCF0058449.1 hypothetical protein [Dyadobacter sp. CY356]
MKEYYFEYTDQKFLTVLVGMSLIIMVGIIIFAGSFVPPSVSILFIFMSIASPFLVFFLNIRKINRQVTAYLDDNSVVLDFEDHSESIEFSKLKSYQIDEFSSVTLRLNFYNNHKIQLTASSGYSDTSSMKLFCQDLEQKIIRSNKNHFSQVKRIGSIFEKGWMLWILISGTAIFAGILISHFSEDKLFTLSFYSSIAGMVGIWLSYFRAKQKGRLYALRINDDL